MDVKRSQKFSWFLFVLKLDRLVAVPLLSLVGVVSLLVLVHTKPWLFVLLWVLLILYAPAETLEAFDNMMEYWKTRRKPVE